MVASLCHQRSSHQTGSRRQQIAGHMPNLRNQSASGPSNLPKLYFRSQTDEHLNDRAKNTYFKAFAGVSPGEVPGLRRYDDGFNKVSHDPKPNRNLGKKGPPFGSMPKWLPDLFGQHPAPFSKDFPTNLLLSKSKFWPALPPKNNFLYGKGLKWPKVKHMVVKHPKFIESCPDVRETLWSYKSPPKLSLSYKRKGTIDIMLVNWFFCVLIERFSVPFRHYTK